MSGVGRWETPRGGQAKVLRAYVNANFRCPVSVPTAFIQRRPEPQFGVRDQPPPRVFILRLWEHISVMRFPSCREGINAWYNQCFALLRAHRKTEDTKLHEVAQIEQPSTA